MDHTVEKARLKWACRRGMLELDLYLMPFFQAKFDQLSLAEQAAFRELLECADTDIYNWLVGAEEPQESRLKAICKQIHAYQLSFLR